MEPNEETRRVLIFLLGSLGDTLVALPSLHLVARKFPNSERRILTHFSLSEKAAPMSALLDGTGLVQNYFRYPGGTRNLPNWLSTLAEIRRWKPQVLIYLHEPRGRGIALRDAAFFRACGIRRMIGIPFSGDLQIMRIRPGTDRHEQRSEYLARSLTMLGNPRLDDRASWSLALTDTERQQAYVALSPLNGCEGIVTVSIGTKLDVNDWGDTNWRAMLSELGVRLPGWGLAIIGAPVERARSEALLASWPGRRVNLCGTISLRESAAVLEISNVYVGHDSGPMHLAAAVGTPCVAVFSARNPPGEWFPHGPGHIALYEKTECYGCRLGVCVQFGKKCILAIRAPDVVKATLSVVVDSRSVNQ